MNDDDSVSLKNKLKRMKELMVNPPFNMGGGSDSNLKKTEENESSQNGDFKPKNECSTEAKSPANAENGEI